MSFDLDQRTPRPDVCIGTNSFHTPLSLIDAAREHCTREGWTLGIDWPYAGTMVPLEHLERTPLVMSIMVEINRDRYMRLEGNRAVRSEDFESTRLFVGRLLSRLRAAAATVADTPTT